MKKIMILASLMIALVFSFAVANSVEAIYELGSIAKFSVGAGTFTVITFAGFQAKPSGAALATVDVELWANWIREKLFANNSFLNFARNADSYVLAGKVVYIPQAGTPSNAERNRSSLPATVSKRADTIISYALDEFTTDPRLIPNADKILSYDKMNSAMGQDMAYLRDLVARFMIYHWRPTASADYIIPTAGAAVDAHLPSATGHRKKLTLAEIEEAAARMDEKDIPDDGNRYMMMDARMYQQFVSLLSTTEYRDFSKAYDAAKRVVGEWAGFQVLKRSKALIMDSDELTAKDPEAEAETTDCAGILLWHSDFVERALGDITLFQDQGNPLYYGDIYSLLINAGGRKNDADGDGVLAIVQKATA